MLWALKEYSMSDEKDDKKELNSSLLVADIMLRITALEKLLIEKGVFTSAELTTVTDDIAKRVAKVVLDKVQAAQNVVEPGKNTDN